MLLPENVFGDGAWPTFPPVRHVINTAEPSLTGALLRQHAGWSVTDDASGGNDDKTAKGTARVCGDGGGGAAGDRAPAESARAGPGSRRSSAPRPAAWVCRRTHLGS